jgi:hypothetical protein
VLARQDTHTLTLLEYLRQVDKQCASFEDFAALRGRLESPDWEYFQLSEAGLKNAASDSGATGSSYDYVRLDRELGDVLQLLGDDTVIAVVGEGCFVLVSSNNPMRGEIKGGLAIDVGPTVLELAGYPLPPAVRGKSWVAGNELKNTSLGLSAEEEEILRERLSGLGYL